MGWGKCWVVDACLIVLRCTATTSVPNYWVWSSGGKAYQGQTFNPCQIGALDLPRVQVVVKIQHQHVRRLIGTDLRNMQRIAKFLGHTLPFDLLP